MTTIRSLAQARYYWGLLLYLLIVAVPSIESIDLEKSHKCGESGQKLKYIWGDALTDSADCVGPNNIPYPLPFINRTFRKNWASSLRTGRTFSTIDPLMTKKILLENYENHRDASGSDVTLSRNRRDLHYREVNMCQSANPTRLCKTRYNTTAPMYGVSLTSGQPVTIVQKFPDLLQQVIYEVCESNECDIVHGECTQTFVPYLFLVIPLGPVTLTGQDYVLVESGCVCKPKHSNSATKSMSALPTL